METDVGALKAGLREENRHMEVVIASILEKILLSTNSCFHKT